MHGVERDNNRISRYLGHGHVEKMIDEIKAQEIAEQQTPQQAQREIRRSRNVYSR